MVELYDSMPGVSVVLIGTYTKIKVSYPIVTRGPPSL